MSTAISNASEYSLLVTEPDGICLPFASRWFVAFLTASIRLSNKSNKKYKRAAKLEAGLIRCSYADSRSTAKPSRKLKNGNDERRSTTKAPAIPSYCGNCGCHITEEARFCPECGAKL